MTKQLFVSHSHDENLEICNCTMCHHFDPFWSPRNDGFNIVLNHCDYMHGRISEPKISWCKTGIVCMWMVTHAPNEVVHLLGAIATPTTPQQGGDDETV